MGIRSTISVDDALFITVLLRNYHTLHLLYWLSRSPDMRTQLFAKITKSEIRSSFMYRSYIAEHGYFFIFSVYVMMVVVFGLVQFTLENDDSYFSIVWNGIWVVTYTQTTIGYGDRLPSTFLGKLALVLSCFIGVFTLSFLNSIAAARLTLSLNECNLYSELLYQRCKQSHKTEAVVVLQRWWRLIAMRLKRRKHREVIVGFYSFLQEYRGVLAECQRKKDRRFERQMVAFGGETGKLFRMLNEYLAPVKDTHALVGITQVMDVLRNEYRIYSVTQDFQKMRRRNIQLTADIVPSYSSADIIETTSNTAPSKRRKPPKTPKTGQTFAKAKNVAMSNLKSRLVRDDLVPLSPT